MNKRTTSLGGIFKTCAYNMPVLPSETPRMHVDLTGDESLSGHCAIYKGCLYARTGSLPRKGYLSCINIANNKVLWRKEMDFGHAGPILIENDLISIGYLIIDSNNGDKVLDLRDYFDSFGSKASGITLFSNGLVFKAVDMRDAEKGLFMFDTAINKGKVIDHDFGDFNSLILDGDCVIYIKNGIITSYNYISNTIKWGVTFEPSGSGKNIVRLLGGSIYVITNASISILDAEEGGVKCVLFYKDIAPSIIDENDCIQVTSVAINNSFIVLSRNSSVDSWILSIALDDFENAKACFYSERDIKLVRLCGDYIFYSNGNNEIKGLTPFDLTACWLSEEKITANSIVSDHKSLVVGSILAGFTIFDIAEQ